MARFEHLDTERLLTIRSRVDAELVEVCTRQDSDDEFVYLAYESRDLADELKRRETLVPK